MLSLANFWKPLRRASPFFFASLSLCAMAVADPSRVSAPDRACSSTSAIMAIFKKERALLWLEWAKLAASNAVLSV
jgi:hypothetical protein